MKPMTVGTGAYTEEARSILEACDLLGLVDFVAGADQVSNPKPAPDTFLRCAQPMGVSPQNCVVFEDSKLGLRAAEAAGMVGVDVLEVFAIFITVRLFVAKIVIDTIRSDAILYKKLVKKRNERVQAYVTDNQAQQFTFNRTSAQRILGNTRCRVVAQAGRHRGSGVTGRLRRKRAGRKRP